ncbi:MAG TPA: hypothetical protein DDY32_05450 [Desulfobulbaceae bacterium]|nr:hypothetical protein [Desulfobulbaceae bacterium]
MKKIGSRYSAMLCQVRCHFELAREDGCQKEGTPLGVAEFDKFLPQQDATLSGFAGQHLARCFFYMVNFMVDALGGFARRRWTQRREGGAGMGEA